LPLNFESRSAAEKSHFYLLWETSRFQRFFPQACPPHPEGCGEVILRAVLREFFTATKHRSLAGIQGNCLV